MTAVIIRGHGTWSLCIADGLNCACAWLSSRTALGTAIGHTHTQATRAEAHSRPAGKPLCDCDCLTDSDCALPSVAEALYSTTRKTRDRKMQDWKLTDGTEQICRQKLLYCLFYPSSSLLSNFGRWQFDSTHVLEISAKVGRDNVQRLACLWICEQNNSKSSGWIYVNCWEWVGLLRTKQDFVKRWKVRLGLAYTSW